MTRARSWVTRFTAKYVQPYVKAFVILGVVGSIALAIPRTIQVVHHPSIFGAIALLIAVAFEIAALAWAIRTPAAQMAVRQGLAVSLLRLALVVFVSLAVDVPAVYPGIRWGVITNLGGSDAYTRERLLVAMPEDAGGLIETGLHLTNGQTTSVLDDVDNLLEENLAAAPRAAQCTIVIGKARAAHLASYPLIAIRDLRPLHAVCDDAAGEGKKAASEYLALAQGSASSAINDAMQHNAGNAFGALFDRYPLRKYAFTCEIAGSTPRFADVARQCDLRHIHYRHWTRSRAVPAAPSKSA